MQNSTLRYFLEVAQTGSLSRASERLYIAVSALSRQIAKLESEVGTPLFDRSKGRVTLTPSGSVVYADQGANIVRVLTAQG